MYLRKTLEKLECLLKVKTMIMSNLKRENKHRVIESLDPDDANHYQLRIRRCLGKNIKTRKKDRS